METTSEEASKRGVSDRQRLAARLLAATMQITVLLWLVHHWGVGGRSGAGAEEMKQVANGRTDPPLRTSDRRAGAPGVPCFAACQAKTL